MTSVMNTINLSIIKFLIILVIAYDQVYADQINSDETARSIYLNSGSYMAKGGWRPIMSSDTLTAYNFANILGGQTIGHKILTGPALIETKVISPHIVNVSPITSDMFGGSIISTSTRPIVTRDANKLTTIGHSFKTSMFPQNLNAPINSYLNPFSLPSASGVNTYKLPANFPIENTMYMKHQQPMMSHRPLYNKIPGHMMGKRLKPNQQQNHLIQLPANNFYQQIQGFPTMKKPIESYQRPDAYKRPTDNQIKNFNQKHVNPQESLKTLTKNKPVNQNIAAVTYKPPYNQHFQQFTIKEEPFGPIPSSILGSFSSFGHASIKARDPSYLNKPASPSPTTKLPYVSTEDYAALSTDISKIKVPSQETKINASKQTHNVKKHSDYTLSLTPPPQPTVISHYVDHHSSNLDQRVKGAFIPSPPDPLNKYQNPPEVIKGQNSKLKQEQATYNTNLSTKRPEITSFFDSTVSTALPFHSESTKAVPDNLSVQVPPPYVKTTYNGHPVAEHPNKFQEIKFFSPTAGHEFFNSKYKNSESNKEKVPLKASYEVTEFWGTGEYNTQPTLHTWINPAQSYKQYNTGLKPPPFNTVPAHDERIIPIYSPGNSKKPGYPEISNVYSTISENNKPKPYHNQVENTISSIEAELNKKPLGDEEYDLAAPENANSDERPKITSTPIFEEETTTPEYKKRIPSRNKFTYDTTTIIPIEEEFEDYTTRFETYKEHPVEVDNDLKPNELLTLPPNKHFKRPVLTTPAYIESFDENSAKKKLKNRRRRPYKPSTTEGLEDVTFTETPIRSRYRTTVPPNEDVTKPPKKIRYPYRNRLTTKPTSKSELTSSAQPTMIPTVPATLRTRLHNRVRATTMSPLDFDDSLETTTVRLHRPETNYRQSSIMKIAKETANRSTSKFNSYRVNETPDYSHKQDEKDTPTSDISLHTFNHKYSAQTLKSDLNKPESDETSPYAEDEMTQTTKSEQLYAEQSSDLTKKDPLELQETMSDESKVSSTTPGKLNRHKLAGKYDSNRPRFSVKDYRNRLNQYSSTSTEKPSHTNDSPSVNTRLRFPNRSRFPAVKQVDSNASESNVNNTEIPRKKFMPKDPRHKDASETEVLVEDKPEEKSLDNEVVTKAITKLKSTLKRDPNRTKSTTTTTTEAVTEPTEKTTHKPSVYTNVKRPVAVRKRLPNKNETEDEQNTVDTPIVTTEAKLEVKNETSTEKYTSETAIMKIAKDDKKRTNPEESGESSTLDQSQRVSDLTLAASKEYNSSGLFKSVSPNTRRVPNYFTIATDDPILPIEAFFPQLNQKKDN